MTRLALSKFRYRLVGADRDAAWQYAWDLSAKRWPGGFVHKMRGGDYLLIRIHPDDMVAMLAYCRALDLAAGRAPWL